MSDRPKVVKGPTYKYETTCGTLYVRIGRYDNKLVEVWAFMGKAGQCSICQNAALSKSISLGLRAGVEPKRLIKAFKDTECPGFNVTEEGCKSCPDGIARALEEELNAPNS